MMETFGRLDVLFINGSENYSLRKAGWQPANTDGSLTFSRTEIAVPIPLRRFSLYQAAIIRALRGSLTMILPKDISANPI
jgi:hypothetical protein